MKFESKLISLIVKTVIGKIEMPELTAGMMEILIDNCSDRCIQDIYKFVNLRVDSLARLFSREQMRNLNISEERIDYVVSEIKDILANNEITDDVIEACRYDVESVQIYLWNIYYKGKDGDLEVEKYEGDIKKVLHCVAVSLIDLAKESGDFEKKILININSRCDDVEAALKKISMSLEMNKSKLDETNQLIIDLLLMIYEKVEKKECYVGKITALCSNEFKNDKKLDYIKKWNSRMFLHLYNEDNPITMADAFIMPECRWVNQELDIGIGRDDTFDVAVQSFLNYDKTASILVLGVPGVGKTTITAWLANKYQDNKKVHILRFRDWDTDELERGLLKAICNTFDVRRKNLDNTILILDGLDEMKPLDSRSELILKFLDEIRDFDNFKCIITSRTSYIDPEIFQVSCELKKFDIDKVEQFCKIITGQEIDKRDKVVTNLEVLGIPVILYLALMSNVDISQNPSKPELYDRIFAEKGGIFDKFYGKGAEYDSGRQVLRNPQNTKKYLSILRNIAYRMFEKNDLTMVKDRSVAEVESALQLAYEEVVNSVEFGIRYFSSSESGEKPVRLLLCGGGANLSNICDYLKEKLSIECDVLNPFTRVQFDAGVVDEAGLSVASANIYTPALGLALRKF